MEGSILLYIQDHLRAPWLDGPMCFVSMLANEGWLWIVVSLVLFALPKTRKLGTVCVFSLLAGFLITNVALKPLVHRIRPYETVEGLTCIVRKEHDFSFPSGHSMSSFAVAFVLFLKTRRRIGVPLVILAAWIALSRLYVGVHYPSDVIVGTLIGILTATASVRWFAARERKRLSSQC